MENIPSRWLLFLVPVLLGTHLARAQLPLTPPPAARDSLALKLELPFSQPLSFTFDARPTPTFETLRLPLFEGRATLLQTGRVNVSLFEQQVPAVELSCLRGTCEPIVESSIGIDARLSLPALSRRVPETFLFLRAEAVRAPTQFVGRPTLGFGGLLDL